MIPPIPPRGCNGQYGKYSKLEKERYDEFQFADKQSAIHGQMAVLNHAARKGMKFTSRRTKDNMLRVWRTE